MIMVYTNVTDGKT